MRYVKMNGCGNDFVILDRRGEGALSLTRERARAIADRKAGLGCDQIIALEPSARGDVFMRIWNADGEEVSACGNGTRAVAWLLMQEQGGAKEIDTAAGLLHAEPRGGDRIMVDMGAPRLDWREIPVARTTDTVRMDYSNEAGGMRLAGPGGVNMGNPHAVFFVDDVEALPLDVIGPAVEHDAFFPEQVNAGFAEVRARDLIRLRVWERGAGLTKACGTGACAALVAAHRAGLTDRRATILADGGALDIEWGADNHVRMTGPVEVEGQGELAA
ncbi:MAG: diaminopimelate epimerase [Hyphomonadaceae bacterium]